MRGLRPLVVKLGGTTIADESGILAEIAEQARAGTPIVVVHGGGKRLTEELRRLGIQTRFHEGKRMTDDAAMEVALRVLGEQINGEVADALQALGCPAIASPEAGYGVLVGERDRSLGRVVTAPRLGRELMDARLRDGSVPIVPPIALDETGVPCNVNADDAAAAIATGLSAVLVLLTDTDGVRGEDGQRIPHMVIDAAERLIANGVIAAGMVPKVRAAAHAASAGSPSLIADGHGLNALAHALEGRSGTRILP
ncbi:MAG: acetylglutamate kinase [Candidatus Limnocylindrales bacterium]